PVWDSSGFGGRPMVGNPQAGLFYPPVWVAWCSPCPSTLGWLTVVHLLWAGVGTYLLARSQGLSRWPATVAAGIYQASPYLLAQTFEGHYPHVWAASWFPWAFWAQAEHRAGRVRGLFALPPILALASLTGHPQEWLLLVLALSVWVVADAVRPLLPGHGTRRNASAIALHWVVVLGVALSLAAIELIPTESVLPWVLKPAYPETGAVPRNYQLHLVNLLQLLSPGALGGPADYDGIDNYWESVLSFGLIPLVLAAVARAGSSERPRVRGWAVLALLSIWFAAGRQLGLFHVLYRLLPGLSWFRVPARSLFLSSLGMAILGGFGLEHLRGRLVAACEWRRFAFRLMRGAVVVLCILLMIRQAAVLVEPSMRAGTGLLQSCHNGGCLARVSRPPRLDPFDGVCRAGRGVSRILSDLPFQLAVTSIGILTASGCLCSRKRSRRRVADLLGLLALGELCWYGLALLQVAPASTFFRPDPISQNLLARQATTAGDVPPRIRARDNFYLDLQAVDSGIEKTNINDVFQLEHAEALYRSLYAVAATRPERPETPMSSAVDEYWRQVRQGIFDRMAVTAVVSDRFEREIPWPVATIGTVDDQPYGIRPYGIQRNPTALPRAYVVPHALVVADDPASILSLFRSSDPHTEVVMTEGPLAGLPADARQPFTPARWLSLDPDRPVLEVATRAPGLLVIADTWMPGWSASVDGRPARIFRGNIAQRVIPLVNPGDHRIELAYHPPGLALGCAISASAGVAWIAFGFVLIRRRRRILPRAFLGDQNQDFGIVQPKAGGLERQRARAVAICSRASA
ncbi:MAG: hypothetical protein ACP5XB_28880, partial [Isosphaeraceae bacterium]